MESIGAKYLKYYGNPKVSDIIKQCEEKLYQLYIENENEALERVKLARENETTIYCEDIKQCLQLDLTDESHSIISMVQNICMEDREFKRIVAPLSQIDQYTISSIPENISSDTFCVIIGKCRDWIEIQQILMHQKCEHLERNQKVLNAITQRCRDWEETQQVLVYEKYKDVEINQAILNTIIQRCRDWEETQQVLVHEKCKDVKINRAILKPIMQKCRDWKEIQQVLVHEKYKDVEINQAILSVIVEKCIDWREVEDIVPYLNLDQISEKGKILNSFIQKCKNFKDIKNVLSLEVFTNVELTQQILNQIVLQGVSYQQLKELFPDTKYEKLFMENIFLKREILYGEISLLENIHDAIEVYNNKCKDIPLDRVLLNSILRKAQDIDECLRVLKNKSFVDIKPSSTTLQIVVDKAKDIDECLYVIKHNRFNGVDINEYCMVKLLKNVTTRQELDYCLHGFDICSTSENSYLLYQLVKAHIRLYQYDKAYTLLIKSKNYIEHPFFEYLLVRYHAVSQKYDDMVSSYYQVIQSEKCTSHMYISTTRLLLSVLSTKHPGYSTITDILSSQPIEIQDAVYNR